MRAQNVSQATEPVSAGWPPGWMLALGDASLRDASSPAIFQRGKAYATSGSVGVVAEDPLPEPALRAQVTGTEMYTTEVWIEDDALAGSCDCPNAQDGWFCKHQVAVALVWRDRLARAPNGDAETVSPGPARTAKRPRTAKVSVWPCATSCVAWSRPSWPTSCSTSRTVTTISLANSSNGAS